MDCELAPWALECRSDSCLREGFPPFPSPWPAPVPPTSMLAALSPAAINYDETLSTLRYASRARKIVNKVKHRGAATAKAGLTTNIHPLCSGPWICQWPGAEWWDTQLLRR